MVDPSEVYWIHVTPKKRTAEAISLIVMLLLLFLLLILLVGRPKPPPHSQLARPAHAGQMPGQHQMGH